MKIGFVGLGKLGLPCALAVARHGHQVVGTDSAPTAKQILESRVFPHREVLAQLYLDDTTLRYVETIQEVVTHSEIIFCAIQTPHHPMYEGVTRVPETKSDFDYTFLKHGVLEICQAALEQKKHVVLAVISTVLPGTVDRELSLPIQAAAPYVKLAYNPFFIAMGTTIRDYLAPEFVLLGVDDADAADTVERFYRTFIQAPVKRMSVRSAELTKVLYNTALGAKMIIANTAMHICEETGANCDDVMDALCLAHERIISTRYMRPGMGDSGPCHPRDHIAMSWLSERLGLGYDLFGAMMQIREKQTEWIARMACEAQAGFHWRPIVILGKAYKVGTNLTVGSCATLLKNLIEEQELVGVLQFDPEVDGSEAPAPWGDRPSVFVLATPHECFRTMPMPAGSLLIDPWGDGHQERPGVVVKRIGRH